MSYALQVRFRHLAPSEGLIALAAARYKLIRSVLVGPGECTVSLESDTQARPLAHAVVKIHEHGRARAEASASHPDPEVALGRALQDVQDQLGATQASRPTLRSIS